MSNILKRPKVSISDMKITNKKTKNILTEHMEEERISRTRVGDFNWWTDCFFYFEPKSGVCQITLHTFGQSLLPTQLCTI